jgi:hypothetical protein
MMVQADTKHTLSEASRMGRGYTPHAALGGWRCSDTLMTDIHAEMMVLETLSKLASIMLLARAGRRLIPHIP